MKRYYVAGPMRGYPEFNHPAFNDMAQELRSEGHEVFNPAEHDLESGFDPSGLDGTSDELNDLDFSLRHALANDCQFICLHATHIFMLPGWSTSKGATAERALAIALGIVVEGSPV